MILALLIFASTDEQLAQSAEALFLNADAAYARELAQRLGAENPYERLFALRRLRALPQATTTALLKQVVPLVEDQEQRYEGCQQPGCATTSIAEQALLLLRAANAPAARQAVIEQVMQRPATARAFAPLVEPLFGDSASEIVTLVKAAKTVEAQAALLLLASGLRCASSPVDGAQLAPMLMSQSALVRYRAALVVLQRTDGCEHQQASTASGYRARSAGIVEDAIKREQPASALEDLARIGTAGSPMMYVVALKLPQVAAIDALGAMKYRARPVANRLTVLLGGALSPAAHLAVLRAISAIRPPLDLVREPLLASATQGSPAIFAASMQALAELEAPLSTGELELLTRFARAQCKTDTSDCVAANRAISQLGRRFVK